MGSLIRAGSLVGFRELVKQMGGNPEPLMARYGLPADIVRQPDTFYPYRSFIQLLDGAAAELDCPDFGMQLGNRQSLDILGPIAVIVRNEETVFSGFQAIGRFLYVHSPALKVIMEQTAEDGVQRLRYEVTEPGLPLRQIMELSMAVGNQILRLLAGSQSRPLGMYFPHAQAADESRYREVYRCPVHFQQDWCGFHFAVAVGAQRIDNADPQTRKLATDYLELQHGAEQLPVASQVTRLIRRLLPTGQCNIEMIAEQLNLHPRTLQRRLADEGGNYEALLEAERRNLASHYLRESGLYLSQITGLLGYAEQSTFNRSCKRWFGTTPRKYRAQMQAMA